MEIRVKNTELEYIHNQIDSYRSGRLTENEIDALWEKMIEEPEHLEYLKNAVNLEAIAEKQKGDRIKSIFGKGESILRLRHVGTFGRVAAIGIIVVGLISTMLMFTSDYLTEADPMEQIEMNTYRSTNIPEEVFEYQVRRAVNLAAVEKYDEAVTLLASIKPEQLTEEQIISLKLNKGMIYYNGGDYNMAKKIFHDLLDSNDDLHILHSEKAHWILANTYLQLQEKEKARVHIQKTYDLNGSYRRLAERRLEIIE